LHSSGEFKLFDELIDYFDVVGVGDGDGEGFALIVADGFPEVFL
jgi:hypothetical protein